MDADTIVIGAGAAGLAAAAALAGHGVRVVVVEARDRIGGRILSLPTDRSAVTLELGAEFIHGPASETHALLREVGGAAIESGGASWICGDGGVLRPDDDATMERAMQVVRAAATLEPDASVEAYLGARASEPSDASIAQAARAFVEGFDAADPAIASVRGIAREWRSGVDAFSTRPVGGYPTILDELRRRCDVAGVRIRHASVVDRIAYGSDGARVRTIDGATLDARCAVVTLPVGVLRARDRKGSVAFDPPLPSAKARALAGIAMGHVAKVVLRFRESFWDTLAGGRYRDAAFFRDPKGSFQAYWTQMPVHAESVVAWLGGPRAAEALARGRDALIDDALRGFGELLGAPEAARRAFEAGEVHDWSADPYARGAYSYLCVDAGEARTQLAAPLGNVLFFAGEATVDDGQSGTVNGAIASGLRAARQVTAALDGEIVEAT